MFSVRQDRLGSMLEYLEHWYKLNSSATFDVTAHQGVAMWQKDLTDIPGISLNSADEGGEAWMTVDRLKPKKPPLPSERLSPWIVVPDLPETEPHRRESLPDPEDPERMIDFDDDPEREQLLKVYLEEPWKEWSDSEKPQRPSIGIYDKLFNLLQTIETEGAETALELVWGIGVAVWKAEGHPTLRYPMISRLQRHREGLRRQSHPRLIPKHIKKCPILSENSKRPGFSYSTQAPVTGF